MNARWLWAAVLAAPYAMFAVTTPIAAADDPIPICPVNQPSYYNGQPCAPQPCQAPYQQGMMPPCVMPVTQVCPPNMTSYYNGQPCVPQPCTPPYAPGVPPCMMPVATQPF
ncbi:hypothetical protein [Mycolicibacterium brumae]|uniref:Uncharacterized protein n=1 Tax=Mycolicibacterium brumae TaxID=85968 RepID=A0A2G5PHC8_9MYCO|nr:hypothetical protein [Mycolicibacterium brumae]MCV7194475.1 hypothetical protein [Mycolicibacterium brumae]PIB77712.1 hypothetical protein CQY22_001905 [Mycolicibacterium brumae]RWA20084.1 hypothetical protein MBRU_15740 [Mycolicibacterium brumae DSM 44177]UWW10010.1 hypothetical protein L2Z93_003128 [Mycolicibacterium brumae]